MHCVYKAHYTLCNSYIIQVLFLFYGMKNMYLSSSAVIFITSLSYLKLTVLLFSFLSVLKPNSSGPWNINHLPPTSVASSFRIGP